jgi:hypothetical protein
MNPSLAPRLLLLAGLCLPGAADPLLQRGPREQEVSARLSAGVLRLGDTGAVQVTVENASEARVVALPKVAGLEFGKPGAPVLNRSTSWVNGRVHSESTLTLAIPFRPAAEGEYEIPPIALEADGRRLETKALRLTVVVDIRGADFGFLEVRPSAERVIEGQPFQVELLFGWDAEEQMSFAELDLPWWDSLPGAVELEEAGLRQDARVDGIVVNGRHNLAAEQLETRARGARRFVTLRLTKSYLPSRSGRLEFSTSSFEFGRRRQVSFFDSRRESHFVQAPPFTVEVVSLPSEGQPLDFSGAVGQLAARASVDTRDVRAGDSIKFTVEWSGQGNLQFFAVPDLSALDAFRAFRVYGSTEEKAFDRRRVVYDIAPLSPEVSSIPPVALSVYDPEAERYGTVATEPIAIRVRPLERGASLAEVERRFERDIEDIDPRPPGREGGARAELQDRFLLGALVAVPLLGALTRSRVRRRLGDPAAPLERRRRHARRALARALARAGDVAAQRGALLEFLAARTREGVPAWDGRDFARWAGEAGQTFPEGLRREAADLLAELEAATFGGRTAPEGARILALARKLEEAGL